MFATYKFRDLSNFVIVSLKTWFLIILTCQFLFKKPCIFLEISVRLSYHVIISFAQIWSSWMHIIGSESTGYKPKWKPKYDGCINCLSTSTHCTLGFWNLNNYPSNFCQKSLAIFFPHHKILLIFYLIKYYHSTCETIYLLQFNFHLSLVFL